MKKPTLTLLTLIAFSSALQAATTVVSTSTFAIDEGVNFSIGNSGASNFLFTWSDISGTQTNQVDPTIIITAGQTYTFSRTSGSHPFTITDDTLAVTGSAGTYLRDTSSSTVINNARLTPFDDFTADPAGSGDTLTWTPTTSDIGTYYYTCTIAGHRGMTGQIQVIPEPSATALSFIGLAALTLRRRR